MQRPASNRAWCSRWDELSSALEQELGRPKVDVTIVSDLLRERRRLTTAQPFNRKGDPVVPIDEQRLWLQRALEREDRLAQLANQVLDGLGRAIVSLRAGKAVRTRFASAERKPRVFSTHM
ncbi:MAG: hypothetical protein KTR25_07425 [Myxococcales bacterium]|nr:hypothetical protein [Myxococcales bacterium]